MFSSIRTQLAISYALIVFLCLLMAGLSALLLIGRCQRDATLSRHRAAATVLVQRTQALFGAGLDLERASERIRQEARRLQARALLVTSDGLVVLDTAENASLSGIRINYPLRDLLGTRTLAVIRREIDGQRSYLAIMLIANISHDLKTPLTSIKGFAQAMLEDAVHDESGYQRASQIISEEAERMSLLIERLLQLARPEDGGAPRTNLRSNLPRCCAAAVKDSRP